MTKLAVAQAANADARRVDFPIIDVVARCSESPDLLTD